MKEKARGARTIKAFAHDSPAENGQKLGWRISHIVFGFSLVTIISFTLLNFQYPSSEAAFMLIVFNLLFVSLIFPFNGALAIKVSMLSLGNLIGLFWNYVFFLFVHSIVDYFGEFFSILYLILNPFANLMWIVTFYSLGLTFLAEFEITRVRVET